MTSHRPSPLALFPSFQSHYYPLFLLKHAPTCHLTPTPLHSTDPYKVFAIPANQSQYQSQNCIFISYSNRGCRKPECHVPSLTMLHLSPGCAALGFTWHNTPPHDLHSQGHGYPSPPLLQFPSGGTSPQVKPLQMGHSLAARLLFDQSKGQSHSATNQPVHQNEIPIINANPQSSLGSVSIFNSIVQT